MSTVVRANPSQGHGVAQHPLAQRRSQPRLGDHVDPRAQLALEIRQQRPQVDQAAAGLQIDQEVEVAGGVGLAARDRAEHAQIARAVARCQAWWSDANRGYPRLARDGRLRRPGRGAMYECRTIARSPTGRRSVR